MPAIKNSILHDTKKALGLDHDYEPFDPEIIMHINSVIADLHQLGLGPEDGFEIEDERQLWSGLLYDDPRYNHVKSWMFLSVKMLFDPPGVGYVLTAMEKQLEKAEWRINATREDILNPPVIFEPDPDVFGDPFVLDGNP